MSVAANVNAAIWCRVAMIEFTISMIFSFGLQKQIGILKFYFRRKLANAESRTFRFPFSMVQIFARDQIDDLQDLRRIVFSSAHLRQSLRTDQRLV
jgi:hypothetical protein